MISYSAIFIANGAAILLLLTVLSGLKKPLRHGLFEEKIFYAMVMLNILQCVIESVVFYMDGKMVTGYHALLIVLNGFLFINNIVFACFWIIYVDYKLFADMKRIKRVYSIVAMPAVLTIIGCFINFVTPVFFIVDEFNVYQRTDLFLIPYAVTYFYLAYGVMLTYAYRKKANKYMFLPVLIFMIPVMIGSLLQFFFYGYSLVWLGVAIGLNSLFVNVQNEASYIDVLSGLFNRQYLNTILLTHSKREDAAYTLAGIMLDVNDFKSINDRLGHLAGDDAIAVIGEILRTAVGDKGTAFRYGGDEFVILMRINAQQEIEDVINIIKTQTTMFNESEKRPYKIQFSIGYNTYDNQHESIDDFLRKIDASMYKDKRRYLNEGLRSDG